MVEWLTPVGFLLWTGGVAILTTLVVRRMPSSGSASDDYFAGGRSLKWYVVAGSLMLTNLSSEQLVGLNGSIFKDGCLTGIWWEAGASITIMITAAVFLPRYMQSGIITTSSFLGERYDAMLRAWVSMIFVVYYSLVLCPTVLYAGALTIKTIFEWGDDVPLWWITTLIGLLGAIYAISGGLKAVAVSDCFNGIGLLVIGLAIPISAIGYLPNGVSDLFADNGGEDSFPPKSALQVLTSECYIYNQDTKERAIGEPSLPWHVIPFGITLNNMYYWATNQLIVQRALGAESLAQGQKGVVFAACMKVMGFAFLCLPGIVAVQFVERGIAGQTGKPFIVDNPDQVYPLLVNAVMPAWSRGLFLGVLLGSVLSTFNSALNSASTMFALEIYKIYINRGATPERTVSVANFFGVFLTVGSWIVAPQFEGLSAGLFNQLQLFNTIVSLPILSTFFIGVFFTMPDAIAGKTGFMAGAICIGFLQLFNPQSYDDPPSYANIHYLHIFELSFIFAMEIIVIMTYWPAGRKCFGHADRPTAYVSRTDGAKVDMAPWKPLPYIIVGLSLCLTILLFILQTGNLTGFYLFWAVWILMAIALITAPVPDAVKPEGEESEGGIMATVLSLRTNTLDRGSIIAASVSK